MFSASAELQVQPSPQNKEQFQNEEQVRKGGLPPLVAPTQNIGENDWATSGGKPPFLTCSFLPAPIELTEYF